MYLDYAKSTLEKINAENAVDACIYCMQKLLYKKLVWCLYDCILSPNCCGPFFNVVAIIILSSSGSSWQDSKS